MHYSTSASNHHYHAQTNNNNNQRPSSSAFQRLKFNCLSKRDKSSAGRIDPRAVDICAIINARPEYYTTSSCSGRCFLYCGDGIKSWHSQEQLEEEEEQQQLLPPKIIPTQTSLGYFRRYRVNHDSIHEPQRYFNLTTLFDGSDPTGGGDPIPTVGQFDHGNNASFKSKLLDSHANNATTIVNTNNDIIINNNNDNNSHGNDDNGISCMTQRPASATIICTSPIWLRFEPFILHVMCHSLTAASKLMAAARPAFKNVGLTSWRCNNEIHGEFDGGSGRGIRSDEDNIRIIMEDDTPTLENLHNNTQNQHHSQQQYQQPQYKKGDCPRYLVAIWGDEGLDMPLSLPSSPTRGIYYHPCPKNASKYNNNSDNSEWLAALVNERHMRNWKKIDRFVESMKSMVSSMEDNDTVEYEDEAAIVDASDGIEWNTAIERDEDCVHPIRKGIIIPRSYDVVGDVAILNCLPEGDEEMHRKVGESIMLRNKAIKICVARKTPLSTSDRSPGTDGMIQLSGPRRNPMITSHHEYGIKCVVDLQQTFFSPRMAPERLRLSQQVARGERVLIVFAGVGMEALQIVSKTEAKEVLVIEQNEVAVQCLRRAMRMLERNKSVTIAGGGVGAAERLSILEGDALELLPKLECESFDRIVAPRPKEGAMDGDMGVGDAGRDFLVAMLPLLKMKGEVHWYDFAADHELPNCHRTKELIKTACSSLGLAMEVIHVSKVGSVAKRQFRVCVDFRVTGRVVLTTE